MSGLDRVCTFLDEAKVYYLAALDRDQPRVRPFGTVLNWDGKLYLQTGKKKAVSHQLRQNPKAELCAFKDGKWLRLAGELVNDDSQDPLKGSRSFRYDLQTSIES